MITYDEVYNCYVVTINGEYIRSCKTQDAAEMLQRALLKGKREKIPKPKIRYAEENVRSFANANLTLDEDAVILKDDIFARYTSQGGKLHRNAFFRGLRAVVSKKGFLINLQLMHKGVRRCYVKGVKLK